MKTPTKAPPERTEHVVRSGETLWSIAEKHLGDGARYAEIAELNYGRVQADGATLTDSHWITPGWRLQVPRGASPVDTAPTGTHVVSAGETLWDISEKALGDGEEWPEIFAASQQLEQADGGQLSDPDDLRTGWRVVIPSSSALPTVAQTPGPALPAATPPPTAAARPTPSASASPRTPPSPSPTPTVSAADTAAESDGLEETSPWAIRTTGGVGALLAAGVVSTLGTRRRLQQLRRRPGQRQIAPPPPAISATEQSLRTVADPLGVHTVDLVLRTLARHCSTSGTPLPALRALRMTRTHVELYLAVPASLPAPWTTTDGSRHSARWRIEPDEAPILDPADLADIPAPYPALVTLGHDLDDAHFLVDLEYLGGLAVTGPPDEVRSAMAAMALELATSTWADDVRVTVVGDFAAVEDILATGRIHYLPTVGRALDHLATRAAEDRTVLAVAGADDLRAARAEGKAPATWAPEVLVLATSLTEGQKTQLHELLTALPRTAFAVVTAEHGVGSWTLQIRDGVEPATLLPIGVRLRAQLLNDTTRSHVLQLIAQADPELTGEAIAGDLESLAPEPILEELPTHSAVSDAPALEPEPLEAGDGPLVRLLGAVTIEGARGSVETSKRARLTELVTFLALNPGVEHRQIDEAIWPGHRHEDNLNTRNTATSKARSWLGEADSGEFFIPRHAAGEGYRLSAEVRTDWALWCEQVGDGALTASTAQLEAALSLVRGRPFDGVHPRRYTWAEPLRQQMITQIVDVSYELGRRRVTEGRWQAAEAAVVVGLMVEPAWEPLWRLRIMAAYEGRNPPAVREAVARLLAVTDALEMDLDPSTLALLDAVRSPNRVGSGVLGTEVRP